MSQNSKGGTNKDHEDVLIKMGALPKRKINIAPTDAKYLFDLYKEIKFSRLPTTGGYTLKSRSEQLTHGTLINYMQAMQFELKPIECTVMLQIDAIYNQSIE